MSSAWSLRRWSPLDGHPNSAYELVSVPIAPHAIGTALAFLAATVPADSTFVVMRLGSGDKAGVRSAIKAANESTLLPRLCVAVSRSTLGALDVGTLEAERVALMLDDVDAETPLADMANDAIDAVRFNSDYVERASRNLRQGCVLEAMLGLARNLGLCTLGPRIAQADEMSAAGIEFDYVPDTRSNDAEAEAGRTRRIDRGIATISRPAQVQPIASAALEQRMREGGPAA